LWEFQKAQADLGDFGNVVFPAFERLRDHGPVAAMDTGDMATALPAELAELDTCQDIVAAPTPAELAQSGRCQDITMTAALAELAQSSKCLETAETVAPTEPVQPDNCQDVKVSAVDLVPASSPAAWTVVAGAGA